MGTSASGVGSAVPVDMAFVKLSWRAMYSVSIDDHRLTVALLTAVCNLQPPLKGLLGKDQGRGARGRSASSGLDTSLVGPLRGQPAGG